MYNTIATMNIVKYIISFNLLFTREAILKLFTFFNRDTAFSNLSIFDKSTCLSVLEILKVKNCIPGVTLIFVDGEQAVAENVDSIASMSFRTLEVSGFLLNGRC